MHSQHPSLARPPYPREPIASRQRKFDLSRALKQSFAGPFARLSDHRLLFNETPRCHVVLCGFPRSGTTLFQLIARTCLDRVQTFRKERGALDAARFAVKRGRYLFTKRPPDLFQIEEIRAFYKNRNTDLRLLLFCRDPRDILTSFHKTRPDEFYIIPEVWRAYYEHWKWAAQFPDVLSVRYEDLILNPLGVESQMEQHIGWRTKRPFSEFHQVVANDFDTRALNGVRPLDLTTVQRWKNGRFHWRLRELVERDLPELPERLIQMGYESDDLWIRDLS
ncbi:MAG TPA: sulfotransferase domain-containing protein [Planctomicrobium sp.]|nr:sulfotransferase domain-containing protein [Planctomicrobium sp.]